MCLNSIKLYDTKKIICNERKHIFYKYWHCFNSIETSRLFIYEIETDVMLWRPFRQTIFKMEDSNK